MLGIAPIRNEKPSPSGRGLGEGETHCAAQPQPQPPSPPTPVIPAKAGIHPYPYPHPETAGGWIPAYAGMTAGAARHPNSQFPYPFIPTPTPSFPRKRESTPRPIATPGTTGVLDSGLRRNDGVGRRRQFRV